MLSSFTLRFTGVTTKLENTILLKRDKVHWLYSKSRIGKDFSEVRMLDHLYSLLPYKLLKRFLSALTNGEEGLWSITISGSLLRSFLSCSWCSRAKPAAMSLATKSVSCNTSMDLVFCGTSHDTTNNPVSH